MTHNGALTYRQDGEKGHDMTIKTLEYIHRLLVEEEAKTGEVYKAARKLQHEYEESETTGKDLAKKQEAAADEYMKIHIAAVNALEEFESHEW
mgnify:FL=1